MKSVVIGNGLGVLGTGLGKVINSFDVVIRINDFVIDKFENDIGSKTNIWVTNGMDDKITYNVDDFDDVIISSPDFDRKVDGVYHYIPKKVISEVNHLFRKVIGNTNKYPTTGLYTAAYFAKIYGSTHIFGLNGLNDTSHYYDKNCHMDLAQHDNDIENNTFQWYISNGKFISLR